MIESDIIIIGSGLAGLSLALRLSNKHKICLIAKSSLEKTNSSRAQGGIAAVGSKDDKLENHLHDTLKAGCFLNDQEVVKKIVEEGPSSIQDLTKWGVNFDKDAHNHFHLGLEGGHSKRRVYHVHDESGLAIHSKLLEKVKQSPNIEYLENYSAIDLITNQKLRLKPESHRTCYGVYLLNNQSGDVITAKSKICVLATGGAGKIYKYTSNWEGATGDGIAIAYRAGCRLGNMEFMQFHPTCLYHRKINNFLITEALRGEGAVLINKNGKAFAKQHPQGELAPRDIVARMIDEEMKTSGVDCVYLDISHKSGDWLQEHFPKIKQTCAQIGIEIEKDPIPVVPAAHYLCGGVWTNLDGSTDVDRLYCIGESAYTGLHGANRLASSSLLECVVQAKYAANSISQQLNSITNTSPSIPDWQNPSDFDRDELAVTNHIWDEIRNIMWNYVGIVRSNKRLSRAKHRLQYINSEVYDYYWDQKVHKDILELRNLALIAKLSVISAEKRKESRGCHYNIDYPEPKERYLKPTILNPNYR